jgi:hypothetical protein
MDPEIEEIDPEFAAAFNEGEDATGLGAAAEDAGAAEDGDEDAAGDDDQAAGAASAAPAAEAAGPAQGAGAALSSEDLEREAQKLRSWEGRLKAREAELSGKVQKPAAGQDAEQASEMLEGVAGAAAVGGSEELAQAANAAAEAVESGEMTPEQAMAQLSEDFGNEFIGMIKVLAKAFAKEEVEPVAKKADELDTKFNSTAERAHFTAIAARHPDFRDVAQSPDFKAFLDGLPDDVRADAQNVAQGGTAEEVIDLLDVFKETAGKKQAPAAAAQPSQEDTGAAVDEDLQSMEGVRSGGVRLPEKPAAPRDDFEGAWAEF